MLTRTLALILGALTLIAAALVVGCTAYTPPPKTMVAPPERAAAKPADSAQVAALGQRLFFERRLSADGRVACASCHDPARAFTDGRMVSAGVGGREGQRNAPTVINAGFNK